MYTTARHLPLPSTLLLGALLAAAALAPSLLGCGDDTTCNATADCFKGQVCNQGTCGAPIVIVDPPDPTQPDQSTTPPPADQGTTTPPADQSTTPPPADQGTTTPPADQGIPPVEPTPDVCRVNPFSPPACMQNEDDLKDELNGGNNTFRDRRGLPERGGCFGSGDAQYKGLDRTLERNLCHWEAADWYRQNLETCNTLSFVATFEFEPQLACLEGEVIFEIMDGAMVPVFDSRNATELCAAPNIQCQALANQGWRIQLLFPPKNVESARTNTEYNIGVYGVLNAQYPYTLRVHVPEKQ